MQQPTRAPQPTLIAAALNEERAALEALATDLVPHQLPGLADGSLLIGHIDGHRVALLRCGVGKVASVVAVTAALALQPRCVISVGSAGALHAGYRVGDVLLANDVVQHDFAAAEADGFRLFGYGSTIPSKGDPLLIANSELVTAAFDAAAPTTARLGINLRRGRIATGDWFVADQKIRDAIATRTTADLVEMEGAAIAYAARTYGIPWLVIRSVSDAGDGEASLSFWEYLALASKNAAEIVRAILPALESR
ncbi:MAG: 5'-methylthioadenosine/S-adenosylhomocysteine nucleosidase [bacterium]